MTTTRRKKPAPAAFGVVPLRTDFQVSLNEKQSAMLACMTGAPIPARDEVSEICLAVGDGHSGYGLYVWLREYPEEGAVLISKMKQPPARDSRQSHPNDNSSET